jgi:hypothetical protein
MCSMEIYCYYYPLYIGNCIITRIGKGTIMKDKIIEAVTPQMQQEIERVINGMTFTKNFR